MKQALRQAAAATSRSLARRELSTEPGALLPWLSSPLFTRVPTRTSSSLPRNVCLRRRRRQTRGYSTPDSSGSTTTAATTTRVGGKPKEKERSDPLRILFCGSDEFSCASLEALHREHVRNPALIESIDVVVRPGKRTGRGYKVVQHPPIRDLATRLGLPIHERDTFTGWDMPSHTNLIIAVSFGLFVPPRLLRGAKYGGLNVHPSLLPDLRGPAPLQHALLAGRRATGVSLQTLDPARFDHGLVLARTAPPLAIPQDCDSQRLLADVTPVAAQLLVRGLRDGVHVPPLEGLEGVAGEGPLLHAPKVTKQDRRLRREDLPHLGRRYRALGSLWFYSRDRWGARKRIIVERVSSVPSPPLMPLAVDGTDIASASALVGYGGELALDAGTHGDLSDVGPSVPYLLPLEQDPDTEEQGGSPTAATTYLVLWFPEGETQDGTCYLGDCRIEILKVEGEKAKPAALALKDFLVPVGVDGEIPGGA